MKLIYNNENLGEIYSNLKHTFNSAENWDREISVGCKAEDNVLIFPQERFIYITKDGINKNLSKKQRFSPSFKEGRRTVCT